MTIAELNLADRHRQIAGAFTDRVRHVKDWDAATPVPEWTARDVVRHLVEWLPGFLASGSDVQPPRGPDIDQDPVASWAAHCGWVQALLNDQGSARRMLNNRHIGSMPLDRAIDQFYTTDVFMHTWDLARATGQDDRLDADYCAQLVDGMETYEEAIRSSGQYGPRVPTPPGSDAQTRLLGFIGRDPFWTPAS
jgi:uncharacterized protein (TIGR03086 family)